MDILIAPNTNSRFVLTTITNEIVVATILSPKGEIIRHTTLAHNIKASHAMKIGYMPFPQSVLVINTDDPSLYISTENLDSLQIQEATLKLDSTKKYAPVVQNELILLDVICTSSHQPHIVLIAQSKPLLP